METVPTDVDQPPPAGARTRSRAEHPAPDRRGISGPTVVAMVGTLLVVVGVGSMLWRGRPFEIIYARWILHNAPTAVATLWLGRAIARRQPSHGLGRLLLIVGFLSSLHVVTISLADARIVAEGFADGASLRFAPADLPLSASLPLWVSTWIWIPPAVSAATLLLLLFPDGRLPDHRWRPVLWATGAAVILLALAYMFASWPTSTRAVEMAGQPVHDPVPAALSTAGGWLLLVAALASIASLGVRWRRAASEERQQLRAVIVTGAIMAATITLTWPWQWLWVPGVAISIAVFLITYGVAVLRFRLHDLDLAINRTVVGALLAVMVTAVYVAVVAGLGGLIGRRAGEHPLLPLLAVGLIAVLFEPARRRSRKLVDRLLYGRDADAYDVLAELSTQLRGTGSVEEVADRVTDLLVRSTGAAGATITTTDGGEGARTLSTGGVVDEGAVTSADIVHDGELLGAVHLHARSGSDLAPDASALLHDVAGTLGTVLRNDVLTGELRAQVAELRRSRERLLTAQDEARRALERDLHDGAQAQLVALRLQLGLTADRARALGDDAVGAGLRATLEQLGRDTDAAIRSLRDLSRGLHPPLLTTGGITAALRAAARGLPVDVEVDGDVGRHAPALEAGLYFCCLEAVKNAATHGAARHVRVSLGVVDGRLRFAVEDDGVGFDPDDIDPGRGLTNLTDRVAALDGEVTVHAAPGRGTVVAGTVPVQPLVSER